MNSFTHVPPGFRFHPTDEELVDYYLRKKVASKRIDLDVIKDVDLYKIEPWDLQELCRIGNEEQNEWYFFSHKDKKYPTGTRTNRATKAGFWKATGRDKAIYLRHSLIGMRKTLVFYKGRAPNGQKSDWIMHEYRLETNENGTPQEEGWVVCRVFKKRMAAVRKMGEYESAPCNWYDDQLSFVASELESSPRRLIPAHPYANIPPSYPHHHPNFHCKQELELHPHYGLPHHHQHHHDPLFLQLPQLESPKVPQSNTTSNNNCSSAGIDIPYAASNNFQSSSVTQEEHVQPGQPNFGSAYGGNSANEQAVDQVTDWRVLDKFVASQLSSEDGENIPKEGTYTNNPNFESDGRMNLLEMESKRDHELLPPDYASTSTSTSCQIDLWK